MIRMSVISSRLLVGLSLMLILTLSVAGSLLPASNALIQRDFSYLNDQHLTVSNGNTKVCGDHLCASGEWDRLQETLAAAQQGYKTPKNTTQSSIQHTYVPSTMSDSSQSAVLQTTDQINPSIPGMPYPIPSPIPVPNPTPQTALKSMNQMSTYVGTDKSYYELGMQQEIIVYIHGQIPNLPNGTLTISVRTPYGVNKLITTYTDASGSFSLPYLVDVNAPAGMYYITVDYKDGQVSASFFVMRD